MPRRFGVIIGIVTCLAVVVGVMLFVGHPHESHADPLQGTPRLELDMDPTNGTGPCNPVDTTVQHQTGDTYTVAVCLTDAPSAPSAIDFTVTYDDTLNQCLPTPCSASDGHCLDSNPDANTGATVFSSPSLGTNWECGLGAAPRCDDDPLTGPGHGAAHLGCFSELPPTLPAGPGVSSPIAEVRLHAFAPGTDNLSLQQVLLSDSYTDALVDCEGLGDCFGGSDTKTGSPVTPLPVATATPTTQPTPTPAVTTAPHFADVQIDMDPTNGSGPCNPVDASAQHNVGDVYSVAVCLTNSQSPPGVFQYNLVYDDSANQCVPTACAPDDSLCLDSNPDANAGSTVFSTPSLGTGWTCEAGNVWPPNCDEDPATGPGHGVAYIGCLSLDSSTQTLPVGSGVSAPLAEVKFRALTPGTQSLSLLGVDAGDSVGNTLVACGDGSTCSGGTNTNVPYPMFADVIPAGTGDTGNLWVMKSCVDATKGEGCLEIDQWIHGIFDVCDSNNVGCTVPEGLGAWEHELFWDKQFVSVSTTPDNAWLTSGGRVIPPNGCFVSIINESSLLEGCVTKDTNPPTGAVGPEGDGVVEKIIITPNVQNLMQAYNMRATKDNGVVTTIADKDCEVTDTLGEQIPGTLPGQLTPVCSSAFVTIRMLEGDLNLDCKVDVSDDQAEAFHYGATLGLQLYNQWYDLEPASADGDVDIKDLQFVFGRNYSTCDNPIPNDQATPVAPIDP